MSPFMVKGYYADQGEPQAFGKSKQFSAKPCDLHYLVAVNKSGAVVYIELYDSASGASGTPRVLPCPDISAGGFAMWTELRMRNGIFVRAVDAAEAGSLIGTDDVKFDCGYMDRIV